MVYDGLVIDIVDEMCLFYLDYVMLVIVSWVIFDLCDGLKFVYCCILFVMNEIGNIYDKFYCKLVCLVGDVMGKYYLYGDVVIYDVLVWMVQDFFMLLLFLDGQGNFGSMDGDFVVVMCYIEVWMDKFLVYFLMDIDKDIVEFQDNYDGKDCELMVLFVCFLNMLVNGVGGIVVGMVINILLYNLGEVIDVMLVLIESLDLFIECLMEIVFGLDFLIGGIIFGCLGICKVYLEGCGSVVICVKIWIEEGCNGCQLIVLDEILFQVNKVMMIEKIVELVKEKCIEGIVYVQDEFDCNGVRVVVELKCDVMVEVVLNQLFCFILMQISFGCNMLVLNGGCFEQLMLCDFLMYFLIFCEDVVVCCIVYELCKVWECVYVLCGLVVVVLNVDEVVVIICSSVDVVEVCECLMLCCWFVYEIVEYL